jgi:hypothetical protein
MNIDDINFETLKRLRDAFLSGKAGAENYWQSTDDLENYDRTFAQRIAWKWRYVFAELRRRNWSPPETALFDWGCGTGIASREFLAEFGASKISTVQLHDRSSLAMNFAEQKLREKNPDITIEQKNGVDKNGVDSSIGVLLISHVLTELTPSELEALLSLATKADAVIWVDVGTYECSRKLIEAREILRAQFQVVAPCVHNAPCGMLDESNEKHWCHHFAASPPEVFTSGAWAKFGSVMNIDLRQLPLSYLALDKFTRDKFTFDNRPCAALPKETVRIIGQARVYKGYADLLCCNSDGVSEKRLTKRALPEAFRRIKKDSFETLQAITLDGENFDGENIIAATAAPN